MARIAINLQKISSAAQLLQCTQLELSEVENELVAIKRSLSPSLLRKHTIADDLTRTLADVCALHRQVKQLRQFSDAAVASYRTAEHHISFYVPNEKR